MEFWTTRISLHTFYRNITNKVSKLKSGLAVPLNKIIHKGYKFDVVIKTLQLILLVQLKVNLPLNQFGIESILSFVTCIDNTVLNRRIYCFWWHFLFRDLMSYHQESRPKPASSNCDHLGRYLLFACIFVWNIHCN